MLIRIGDTVEVSADVKNHRCPEGRENNLIAVVVRFYGDDDTRVITERDLQGCRYWNVADLEIAGFKF